MAKCWVKKELPSQGYSNISVRVWETALMCCWLIHFRNGHPSDSSRESKSWFPPQHSLFKHNPWSDVLCWQGIYLFTMLLMEIFKFFKPACVKYKCRCVLGVPGGWIPISTSWVWSHWVFLHCCAFILTGGIAAKIWDRSGSVAVAGEFWKLFSCAVSSVRKKTWEKFLCSVLCEEKKTWEKFFSCAMFSVRKTGHPWLVWPAEEGRWNRKSRQVCRIDVPKGFEDPAALLWAQWWPCSEEGAAWGTLTLCCSVLLGKEGN